MADIPGPGRVTRLDRFKDAHPEVGASITRTGTGWWTAWVPRQGGDPTEGTAVSRRDLGEFLARLEELVDAGGGLP